MAFNESELLSLPQVASYLGMAERTIYLWAQQGRIPAIKLGSSWRFRRSEVDAWLTTQRTGPSVASGRAPLVPAVEPPKSRWRTQQEEGAADRAMVEACVTFIRETMRTDDREVWLIEQFEDRFDKGFVSAAIDQMRKAREITVADQRGLEGKNVPVIKRRR